MRFITAARSRSVKSIFVYAVVIITSLFFIVSMYTTSTCQTVKVLVDNPIMLFDMLPIQNETETVSIIKVVFFPSLL